MQSYVAIWEEKSNRMNMKHIPLFVKVAIFHQTEPCKPFIFAATFLLFDLKFAYLLAIRLSPHHGILDRGWNPHNSGRDSRKPQNAGRACDPCYFINGTQIPV